MVVLLAYGVVAAGLTLTTYRDGFWAIGHDDTHSTASCGLRSAPWRSRCPARPPSLTPGRGGPRKSDEGAGEDLGSKYNGSMSTQRTTRGRSGLGRTTPKGGADATQPFGPVLEFMRLLWAVDHGLQSVSKSMTKTLGITGPQRLVIRMVGCRPGISAGDLAELLHVHPSTLTGVLQRLHRRGLIARSEAPDDRRRAVLRLTPRGQSLDQSQSGTVEACIEHALQRVPTSRRRAAQSVLAIIAAELQSSAARVFADASASQ